MDSFKDLMENVFFPQQYVMLDMKVMEMEIVFQLQWQQFAQVDMKVMVMEIVY